MSRIPPAFLAAVGLSLLGAVLEPLLPWHAFGPLCCLAGAVVGARVQGPGWLAAVGLVTSAGLLVGAVLDAAPDAPLRALVLAVGVITALLLVALERRRRPLSPRALAFDLVPVACVVTDASGQVVDANQQFCTLLGQDRATVLQGGPGSFIDSWVDQAQQRAYWEALARESRVCIDAAARIGEQMRQLRVTGQHERLAGRDVVLHVVEDLSDLRGAEAALGASEARTQAVFDGAGVGMGVIQGQRLVRANPRLEQLLGYAPGELDGRLLRDLMHPDDYPKVEERHARLAAPQADAATAQDVQELRYLRKDGSVKWLRSSGSVVEQADGQPFGVGVYEDVTERKQINQSLIRTETKYSTLFHMSPLLVALGDLDSSELVEANDTFYETTGWTREELVGRATLDSGIWHQPSQWAAFVERLRNEDRLAGFEVQVGTRDGRVLSMEMAARRIRLDGRDLALVVLADVSAQRRLEQGEQELQERLRRAERLEALGVLAGGIAHDFNNLLAGIGGNADLLVLEGAESPVVARRAAAIRDAVQRGADLTRRMLAYGGHLQPSTRPVDLCAVLEEHIADHLDPPPGGLQLEAECADGGAWTRGDQDQLARVVREVVDNALEATAGSAARLRLWAGLRDLDAGALQDVVGKRGLDAGTYAMVEVADNGPGIPADALSRVIDPFFSTREPGRGLGLSAAVGILRAHGGGLRLVSGAGGTCVTLLLPADAPPEALAADPADEVLQAPASATPARPQALLVDDDDSILTLLATMLDRFGWDCIRASDGDAASTAMDALEHGLDLAMIDLTLPGRPGREVLAEVRDRFPGVPLVAMSGRSEMDIRAEFEGWDGLEVLPKPFAMADLKTLVGRVAPDAGA